jgi:hypothetical protein
MGTMKMVIPLYSPPGDVFVASIMCVATSTPEIIIFWPLMTNSSPSRTARVSMCTASDPAFGSVRPKHPRSSPAAILGSQSRFCSSLPLFSIISPAKNTGRKKIAPTAALPYASSSAAITKSKTSPPEPLYSSENGSPNKPVSFTFGISSNG